MYKALFPFQKTHPTSLSFVAGDIFLSLPGARADKNWHFVVDQKGCKGFVPRNYVNQQDELPSKDEYEKLLEKVREGILSQRMGEKERADLLGKLEDMKKCYNSGGIIDNKQNSVIPGTSNGSGGNINASGIDTESNSALPKAPSPRPDSLSSNEELKGNVYIE